MTHQWVSLCHTSGSLSATPVALSRPHLWLSLCHTCGSLSATPVALSLPHLWLSLCHTSGSLSATPVALSLPHQWLSLCHTSSQKFNVRYRLAFAHSCSFQPSKRRPRVQSCRSLRGTASSISSGRTVPCWSAVLSAETPLVLCCSPTRCLNAAAGILQSRSCSLSCAAASCKISICLESSLSSWTCPRERDGVNDAVEIEFVFIIMCALDRGPERMVLINRAMF